MRWQRDYTEDVACRRFARPAALRCLPRFSGPVAFIALLLLLASPLFAAKTATHFGQTINKYGDEPDDWFKSDIGRNICDNILSWQNANGGWWKNYNPKVPRPSSLPPPAMNDAAPGDTEDVWRKVSTFDNDATYTEMRIMARAHRVLGDAKFKDSFNRGLAYIFESQYANGGWPQRYPLQDNYGRYITFNDGAMTGVMLLLRDVFQQNPDFTFVAPDVRQHCKQAFDRGIQCILKCQIRVHGKLTAWCQQHDPVTFAPRGGRTFERPGITADESAGVVMLLMELPHPDSAIRDAIESACNWYQRSEIVGKRYETRVGKQYQNGRDRILVDDPGYIIWARYYDIDTNRPFFCGRDGIKRWSLTEVPYERRVGYTWYGTWGKKVAKAYREWKSGSGQ